MQNQSDGPSLFTIDGSMKFEKKEKKERKQQLD